ncbi:hypothetical protein [Mesorhizobium sp.]|uniref:hypothetical protein n=1 Tax=Mesorhizobium sp. TaxID=1871066 RepID=UPI00257D6125|nr:hypothetical protein [Mesorhizobium sp.]
MAQAFAATVGAWALKVEGALQAIFQESAQELVGQLDQLLVDMVYAQPQPAGYTRTGFLRASFMASTTAMPQLTRDGPGISVPPTSARWS